MENKSKITLTGFQLKAALDLVGDDLETEITLREMGEWFDIEEGNQPAGIYAEYDEYPEFGLYGPLEKIKPEISTKNDDCGDILAKAWGDKIDADIRAFLKQRELRMDEKIIGMLVESIKNTNSV